MPGDRSRVGAGPVEVRARRTRPTHLRALARAGTTMVISSSGKRRGANSGSLKASRVLSYDEVESSAGAQRHGVAARGLERDGVRQGSTSCAAR